MKFDTILLYHINGEFRQIFFMRKLFIDEIEELIYILMFGV